MSSPQKRLVIDVSNLSIHSKKFIKTGIQEVIYKTLINTLAVRKEFPDWEILLLPQLPRRFGNSLTGITTVPYPTPPKAILESIEKDLGLESKQVWGLDIKALDYQIPDSELLEIFGSADRVHIQGLANVGPLAQHIGRPTISMTIYDLIPVLFPEYCPDGIPRWYANEYLPAVGKYVRHAVCISRQTALDLRNHPYTRGIQQISSLPLPFELTSHEKPSPDLMGRLGLTDTPYLVYLGSLEPRKNFDALLEGYTAYRKSSSSPLRLVMVGSTGWKNALIEKRLKESPFKKDIVQTGYLSDADLAKVIRHSTALALLSQYEGYGLPVAQGYSLGTRVITTYGSSLPEACGGDAVFVEPADPLSVAAGIAFSVRERRPLLIAPSVAEWTWQSYARNLIRAATY